MKFTEKTISQEPMILANDHYVAVPYDCTEIETENGLIPAGAILPANDGTARGVLLHAVDQNDDPNGALVIHGFIAADRLPEAPAAAAAAAMPQITFLPIPEAEADDGENDGDGQTVNPPVAG